MEFTAFLLLAASAGPAAAPDAATGEKQPKAERLICKRIAATESRLAAKRICKTARQWREAQESDGDGISLSGDTRLRGN